MDSRGRQGHQHNHHHQAHGQHQDRSPAGYPDRGPAGYPPPPEPRRERERERVRGHQVQEGHHHHHHQYYPTRSSTPHRPPEYNSTPRGQQGGYRAEYDHYGPQTHWDYRDYYNQYDNNAYWGQRRGPEHPRTPAGLSLSNSTNNATLEYSRTSGFSPSDYELSQYMNGADLSDPAS
ncbi:hypothetical protein CRUP_024286, partial [Coryphaenoides rupestris]